MLDLNKKFPIYFRLVMGVLLCEFVTLLLTALHFYYPSLWVVAISVAVGLVAVYLVKWVALAFGRIKPLKIGDRQSYEGIPIYKMKGKYANAYAGGILNNKVIVFTERLVELCDEEELDGVLVHELAHHKYNDAFWGLLLAFLISHSIALVVNLYSGDVAVMLVLASVLVIPGGMIYLAYSRWKERRADIYVAKHAKYPRDLGRALIKMQKDWEALGFATPSKESFKTKYLTTHPSVRVRVGYLDR